MMYPMCNSYIRDVPAALLKSGSRSLLGPGLCDVTLTTPDRAKWMLNFDNVVIYDCDVSIYIYNRSNVYEGVKPMYNFGCASTLPGIVYLDTSIITVRLKRNNSTGYSFSIFATARKASSKRDESCNGFRCGSGACVAKSLMCDNVDNCFDLSDELTNGTAHCDGHSPFEGENWAVLASVLGAALVFGIAAACCRHLRNQNGRPVDDLYELNEGPYVHKYAYRYAVIRPPKKPNQTNVVLGRDGHMHYTSSKV